MENSRRVWFVIRKQEEQVQNAQPDVESYNGILLAEDEQDTAIYIHLDESQKAKISEV